MREAAKTTTGSEIAGTKIARQPRSRYSDDDDEDEERVMKVTAARR